MEEKPFKVRTLPGPPHPVSTQTHPRSSLGSWLCSHSVPAQGSSQQSPSSPATESRPRLGSGSPPPACSSSPPQFSLASSDICGPQASAKSSGRRGSGASSPQDIRNLWTTSTLSQPKLSVQLPTVCEDSELEGNRLGSKDGGWYHQKAGHDSDGGWEELDDGGDKDDFKPEELDEHPLMELEMHRGSSPGSTLEDRDDDSRIDSGQCGLTGLWALTGQGAGQNLNFYCWEMGGNCRTKLLGFLERGANAYLSHCKSSRRSRNAPYWAGVIQSPGATETSMKMSTGSAVGPVL